MKVFIADDSDLVRERLVTLITELETVELVGQAGDAGETLEAIRRLKPDGVILDIHMPNGSGFEVLRAIKREAAGCLVIILTAFPYPQYRKKCLEWGADYFFDKSVDIDRLVEVLKEFHKNGSQS